MLPYVGAYSSEQAAKSTAAKLSEAGFDRMGMVLASDVSSGASSAPAPAPVDDTHADGGAPEPISKPSTPSSDKIEEAVDGLVSSGYLPSGNRLSAIRALKNGDSLVAVSPGFGFGEAASQILSEHGSMMEAYPTSDPAPLSDWFGFPVLSRTRTQTQLNKWSLSKSFGFPLLSSEPAPLSKMTGIKPLSPKQTGWTSSLGLPILSKNGAPLSSMLSMPTTWARPDVVLSRDPTPLSSLFGLTVLSQKKDN
ncbi:MAG: hypothetical protein AAF830_03485 [Pseudomonadota bacterium]